MYAYRLKRLACGTVLGAALAAGTSQATVTVITFDTPAANTSAVAALYGLTPAGGISASVENGQLLMSVTGGVTGFLDFGPFAGDVLIEIEAGLTANSTPGGTGVGLRVGGNNFMFHPGYTGGAFRIDGPGGHGNFDMGFNPTWSSPLNRMSLALQASTGTFYLSVIDGTDPALRYTETFISPGYQPGVTVVGLYAGGFQTAVIDNVRIDTTAAVPEPAAWLLTLLGLAGVALRKGRGPGPLDDTRGTPSAKPAKA